MGTGANPAKMGRPRGFSEEKALDAAMRVFWEKGYAGASLDDLTGAMGINRSSLYASFGDKEELFNRVITRYSEGPLAFIREALQQPTARAVIEALLRSTVAFLGDSTHPRGCLSLQGGLACGSGSEGVIRAMIDWRRQGLKILEKRMRQAQKKGDLSRDVNAKDLARYISVVMNGLSVQAVNGATRTEMNRTVRMALQSMPL
ncbi:MAG TPA: TetR/AcrR family transcriptional regulator [Candidatus Binatia bacterium]|jgi:AcrR family transcriptional regulator|nr:TetR/AcrR family transcriptional regulator [Candidatus Binatia bacterium]